jgi:hypothetical protein
MPGYLPTWRVRWFGQLSFDRSWRKTLVAVGDRIAPSIIAWASRYVLPDSRGPGENRTGTSGTLDGRFRDVLKSPIKRHRDIGFRKLTRVRSSEQEARRCLFLVRLRRGTSGAEEGER